MASTCDVAGHVDETLLEVSMSALSWWAEQSPPHPTSSLTGGGAVAAVEAALARMLGEVHVLALPNATFGLRLALQIAGVKPFDDVLVSGVDWPAACAAVRDLGARPVPMPVCNDTLTVDPLLVRLVRTSRTVAAVVTHLHGVAADVSGLRDVLGDDTVIIEDAAQALGASRDGRHVGTLGDFAVFSLGPGKPASAGELGLLVAARPELYRAAVAASQHPIRQLISGIPEPRADVLIGRASPLACMVGAYRLSEWPETKQALCRVDEVIRDVIEDCGAELVDSRHGSAPGKVPFFSNDELDRVVSASLKKRAFGEADVSVVASGAIVDPELDPRYHGMTCETLDRLRLAEATPHRHARNPGCSDE